MATYTFITDYLGGTYISQQTASDLRSACVKWKDHVVQGKYIQNLILVQFTRAFDCDIDELPPVAIDEVSNVWLFQLLIGDNMLNLHIIQTELPRNETKIIQEPYQIGF